MECPDKPAQWTLSELEPESACWTRVHLTPELVDLFADVSGDRSPLHMDAAFARSRGFPGRVAHGVLLAALASRIVGMGLPGTNALLQSLSLRFAAPAFVGDTVVVSAVVDQVSEAARCVVLRIEATNASSGETLAKGKAQVGLTG